MIIARRFNGGIVGNTALSFLSPSGTTEWVTRVFSRPASMFGCRWLAARSWLLFAGRPTQADR